MHCSILPTVSVNLFPSPSTFFSLPLSLPYGSGYALAYPELGVNGLLGGGGKLEIPSPETEAEGSEP
jgi:hypothetical protein